MLFKLSHSAYAENKKFHHVINCSCFNWGLFPFSHISLRFVVYHVTARVSGDKLLQSTATQMGVVVWFCVHPSSEITRIVYVVCTFLWASMSNSMDCLTKNMMNQIRINCSNKHSSLKQYIYIINMRSKYSGVKMNMIYWLGRLHNLCVSRMQGNEEKFRWNIQPHSTTVHYKAISFY